MPDTGELIAVGETLADLYELLLGGGLPASTREAMLDGLFHSIEALEKTLLGDVGPKARAVLGPLDGM
jgi:hypothetical protein